MSERVLALIQKGPPRTSSEIYEFLRKQGFTGPISAVYSACNYYKSTGAVAAKADDSEGGGGVRKYHPAK